MYLAVSLLNEKVQKFAPNFRAGQHDFCLDSSIGASPRCSFVTDDGLGGGLDFRRPQGTRSARGRSPASELAGYCYWSLRDPPRVADCFAGKRPWDVRESRAGGTSDSSPAFERVGSQNDWRPVGTPETPERTMPHTYVCLTPTFQISCIAFSPQRSDEN